MVEKVGYIPIGGACITSAYGLPCKSVIHAVGPNTNAGGAEKFEREKFLKGCISKSFELVEEYGIQSIAFCAISTGIFGYDT